MEHVGRLTARPDEAALAGLRERLFARFGNQVSVADAVRRQHAHTTTWLETQPPDAVLFAQSTEDVADLVRICAEFGVPVIPFGTGTSLEGHVNAPFGGVAVAFRDMNKVLAVHAEDLDVVIEAGVTRNQLNDYIRDQGLFFPIDPGADASLGGMASTRASGTNAVRYGTMKDNVLSLTVVLPNGELVTTARRARKSSAGYDLTRLFVGSEGTLGVITEITLKVYGIPEAMA
ncbi:MAG TPA: FAD-binding protein, partial [Hyphomicrobiales bacterium]|nr:FAD-binding protein [Hyphomicrobiales bacterium]